MRAIILIIFFMLMCSCFRQSYRQQLIERQEKVKTDPERNYSVQNLGFVQVWSYTYKGKTKMYILHGRKARYQVNVDTIAEYKNRLELSADYYRK